ncbi:hypothetical protein [Mesorhizobium australicum]|uniref:Uncharacterized protein n=1 Tax=Mesorhizobium australicum TaxID=536018 RepID=A0A1X7N0C0_9HYPH|nr:hypothetical protein [Mesorhizobium australicum]SMH30160.1 hypothetical protein SAMN02982922_1006 [Mesorhizobium australicum]
MAFFCLFRLRMTPEQVAVMLDPGDPAMQKIWTIYLRDRFAYARRYTTIARYLTPKS